MGLDKAMFYRASRIAVIPMGDCYRGRGDGGGSTRCWPLVGR
jgi:hypothetical protein